MLVLKYGIRIFFLLAPVIILAWLVDRNLALTSPLEARFDFRGSLAMISALKRDDRVRSIAKENGEYFQTIIGDPVYAEIASPFWSFQSVRVDVKYRIRNQPTFALGMRRGKAGMDMDLKTLFSEKDGAFSADGGEWEWAGADFPLADAYENDKHRFVLIFSAPGIAQNGGNIDVGEIRVRYDRDPLSFSNIWRTIKNRISRYTRLYF